MARIDTLIDTLLEQSEKLLSELNDKKDSIRKKFEHELTQVQNEIDEKLEEIKNLKKLIKISDSDLSRKWSGSLNSEEDFIFSVIENCLNDKLEIWPQVSCSAIFNNKGDKELWYSYNKLYVDFLILEKEIKFKSGDTSCHVPKCIIEYDGKGHDRTDDGLFRDMIKNFLAEKANIPLVRLKEFDGNKESFENYVDRVQKEIKNALYKNQPNRKDINCQKMML